MIAYTYVCRACRRWFTSAEICTPLARCPHCGGRAR